MPIDQDALETWAGFAAQAIQEVIDDAVLSDPETPEQDVCPDLRDLLNDLDRILAGDTYLLKKMEPLLATGDVGVIDLGEQQ